MVTKVALRQASKQFRAIILGLCCVLICHPVCGLSAQVTETGSTTKESNSEAGLELPLDSEQEQNNSNEKKKDERPRELGVMVLILWLLAGTGIGILIFTSLFGHSVRSMVRRPYPEQTQPQKQSSTDSNAENSDTPDKPQEEPNNL